jgi:nucleoside-diphosphate-sugar epimerase
MTKSNLEKGDLILITGGTGWIGSHIVEKALEQGLRVRLAFRNEEKVNKLIKGLQDKHGGSESVYIEKVFVPDLDSESAYDEAIKGVQGVIHAATNLTFSDKWEEVVTPTIRAYKSILNAAHSQGQAIKRVIITGTSSAVAGPHDQPGEPFHYANADSYNDTSVEEAKVKPNPLNIYVASKALSEKYAWDFVKEKKPSFILNVIHPAASLGKKVIGSDYSSSGLWIRNVAFNADQNIVDLVGQAFYIHVDDIALLHILAATREDVENERILGYSKPFNWDQIIDIAYKYYPEKVNTVQKTARTALLDYTIVANERAIEILKPYGGLKSFEQSIRENLED